MRFRWRSRIVGLRRRRYCIDPFISYRLILRAFGNGQRYLLLQPRPELTRTNETSSKAQYADDRSRQHRNPKYLIPIQRRKERGRMSRDRQRIQQPRPSKQRMIRRRKHTRHDNSVNETPRRIRPGHLEHEREWRRPCVFVVETVGRVRDVEAEDEHGEDVEEQDAPEYVADYFWEGFGGGDGFAGGDGDGFGSSVWLYILKGLTWVKRLAVLHANAAVTKTDAKPPIPPTTGASPMNQL